MQLMKFNLDKAWIFIIGGALIFLILSVNQITTVQKDWNNQWLYNQESTSYVVIDGLTYRSESSSEFLIKDYSQISTNNMLSDTTNSTRVNYTRLDLNSGGEIRESQLTKFNNFNFNINQLDNGSLQSLSLSISLFRLPVKTTSPWTDESEILLINNFVIDRWNIISNETLFKSNLGYYEYLTIDGSIQKVKTNLEIVTNSDPNTGRVLRSSIHIVRRNLDRIILSEYNEQIYEKSDMDKALLALDQPSLESPFILYLLLSTAALIGKLINVYRSGNFRFAIKIRSNTFGSLDISPPVEDQNSDEKLDDTGESEEQST